MLIFVFKQISFQNVKTFIHLNKYLYCLNTIWISIITSFPPGVPTFVSLTCRHAHKYMLRIIINCTDIHIHESCIDSLFITICSDMNIHKSRVDSLLNRYNVTTELFNFIRWFYKEELCYLFRAVRILTLSSLFNYFNYKIISTRNNEATYTNGVSM